MRSIPARVPPCCRAAGLDLRVEVASRATNPRLQEKIARDGVRIFPTDCPAPAPASTVAAA